MVSTVTGKRQITLIVQPSKRQLVERARKIGRQYSTTGKPSTVIPDHERARDEQDRLAGLCVAESR